MNKSVRYDLKSGSIWSDAYCKVSLSEELYITENVNIVLHKLSWNVNFILGVVGDNKNSG